MSGTVMIARSIFDHELFADQPLTEREAWIWLIMEAAWKPRKKRAGDFIVDLSRGQLAASVRFMAAAWQWTPAKVQRYVKRLQTLDMICLKSDTGVSVITICNYDEYQSQVKPPDTGAIQERYRSDTNEKKGIKEEEKIEIGKPISRRSDETEGCIEHFNAEAERVGWTQVQKITPARKAALSQRISDCGGEEAWREAITRAAASPLLTGQTGRGWRADFDWLCKAANFTKLMEGNYDPRPDNNTQPNNQRGTGGSHDTMVAAFAGVARREASRPG